MNIQLFVKAIEALKAAFSRPTMNDIYNIAADCVRNPRHLTLNHMVPNEVGCCEAVSWILLNAGFKIPHGGIAGVNDLIDWMIDNGFEEMGAPIPGAIVTAHSPNLRNTAYAHAGVVLQFGMGSNNSATGKFEQNYSLASWDRYFGGHGSKSRYFYHA